MWGLALSAITICASMLGKNKTGDESNIRNNSLADVRENRIFLSGAGENST